MSSLYIILIPGTVVVSLGCLYFGCAPENVTWIFGPLAEQVVQSLPVPIQILVTQTVERVVSDPSLVYCVPVTSFLPKTPDFKELNKQIFFPLTPSHIYRKESLLTETSIAYLNSGNPTKFRVNLNKPPSKQKFLGLKIASSKTSDYTYEYIETLSNYINNKKGELINFNQHIAYNFNKKNILLRGDNPLIKNSLEIKTNKIESTNAVPFTIFFQKAPKSQVVPVAKAAKATENMNKNRNINYPLLHFIGGAEQLPELQTADPKKLTKLGEQMLNNPLLELNINPESNKNTSRPAVANTQTDRTAEPTTGVQTEIPQDLLLISNKLNRFKGVSGETGYNLKGNNRLIKYSYNLLFYFFKSMYCLISKPVFIFTPDKVIIQLQYYLNIPKFKVFKWYSILKYKKIWQKMEARINKNNKRLNWKGRKFRNRKPKIHWKVARTLIRLFNKQTEVKKNLFNLNKYNLFKVFSLKFKYICEIFNNKFNKPVELQLIRIHKSYLDSNILVNLLSLNIKNKKFKTNAKIDKLFQKRVVKNVDDCMNKSVNFIPAYLSGIKIRIGGRLLWELAIPRRSKKRYERGASSIGKVNFLDTASITNTNRKGSYTLKISSGQNFF